MTKSIPATAEQKTDASVMKPDVLASRAEAALSPVGVTLKRMFGGITLMLNGNMLCCATKTGLMVRVGTAQEQEALASPYASPCLGAGRPMSGFIMIEPAGLAQDADLLRWVSMAHRYVVTLPQKQPAPPKARRIKKFLPAGEKAFARAIGKTSL